MIDENTGFRSIIEKYRAAAAESPEAEAMETAFDENTRAWAELVIAWHMDSYGIDPRNKALLWESVKNTNRDILETVEIEIAALGDFMSFYIEIIHEELLKSYFTAAPRLAEIIRKNVKHEMYTGDVLPELEAGNVRNVKGRKIQARSGNRSVTDAWTAAKQDNYPETFSYLRQKEIDSWEAPEIPESDSARVDIEARWKIWEEIEARLRQALNGEWNYDRKPFDNPDEETRNFFRITLNWFLMNALAGSSDYGDSLRNLLEDLEKKERYNRRVGAVDEAVLGKLIRSFEENSPTGFFTEKKTGVEGRNMGVLFDRISNHAYNRLLFPELASVAPPEWGI